MWEWFGVVTGGFLFGFYTMWLLLVQLAITHLKQPTPTLLVWQLLQTA
jgi:hypothetical protein